MLGMSSKLKAIMAQAAGGVRPQDVFSTSLYTGNGSTRTITNGINLSGEGGLVWIKGRNVAFDHCLFDSARGVTNYLASNNTFNQNWSNGARSDVLTGFNSNGFSLGVDAAPLGVNSNGNTFAAWTFRRAPKFFDVVTYTGDGVAGRAIPHSLGTAPGMFIVKRTNASGPWYVWHRTFSNDTSFLILNATDAVNTINNDYVRTANASTFTIGPNADVNANGSTYVAYLFAHDTDSSGIVQCGSFTTDGSGNATVNLGWRPQFLLAKASSTTSQWPILDTSRGFTSNAISASNNARLFANLSNAESTDGTAQTTSSGFQYAASASTTYIYLAIREPT